MNCFCVKINVRKNLNEEDIIQKPDQGDHEDDFTQLLNQKEEEIDKHMARIDSLLNVIDKQGKEIKTQTKYIKKLASNSRYISISGCENVKIDYENMETETCIAFLTTMIECLCTKYSASEVRLFDLVFRLLYCKPYSIEISSFRQCVRNFTIILRSLYIPI